jgi:nitrogen fixation-related uncharacterized protein
MGSDVQRLVRQKPYGWTHDRQHSFGCHCSCYGNDYPCGCVALGLAASEALEVLGVDTIEETNSHISSIEEERLLDVDILIYVIGAFLMAAVSTGFVFWALKTGQFEENAHLKRLPLEEDEECVS